MKKKFLFDEIDFDSLPRNNQEFVKFSLKHNISDFDINHFRGNIAQHEMFDEWIYNNRSWLALSVIDGASYHVSFTVHGAFQWDITDKNPHYNLFIEYFKSIGELKKLKWRMGY